jgi:hypothetical protein
VQEHLLNSPGGGGGGAGIAAVSFASLGTYYWGSGGGEGDYA